MSFTITELAAAKQAIRNKLGQYVAASKRQVTVGIHADENAPVGDGDMTMAGLGAMLNYGADINHPGGTDYGYATEDAEKAKKVTFLKTGTGYKKLGTTGPHVIKIPPRPWLVPGIESGTQDIADAIADGVIKDLPINQVLEQVGSFAAGAVQQYMTDLRDPPNAASTIRKKGSDNPLINTGALRASVTYKVENK